MSELHSEIVQELQQTHVAIKLSRKWMGVRKSLTKQQKESAAQVFGAHGEDVSASKRLLDTKHEAWKAVEGIKREAGAYFQRITLDFPVKQVRLLKQDKLESFSNRMCSFTAELDQAVAHLQDVYGELREQARNRLGSLFNASDYPPALEGEFGITWEPVTLDPPDYLKDLAPRIYEQHKARIQARLAQAVDDAEDAFLGEMAKLLGHLQERLSGDADGQAKQFAPSTLSKISDFFTRFGDVSLRSNADLDALVERAQNVCRGVTYDSLKNNGHVRDIVRDAMQSITADLDSLMERRPKRMITFDD